MSLVRRIASATVLAVTVTGAVLSLTGAASAETGWPNSLPAGASSTPPVSACCPGVPSPANGGWSGADASSAPATAFGDDPWKEPGPFATAYGPSDRWAITASFDNDMWK